MIITVIGGSASGKSKIAEDIISSLCDGEKYYVATMQIGNDEENIRRVAKHREQRKDKGFVTVERPVNIEKALDEMGKPKNVLLECVSNLTANEMFSLDGIKSEDEVVDKVASGIKLLGEKTDNLVIVSNNIFEDGVEYDEITKGYLRALGRINKELIDISDEAYEAVVGIKVRVKG